MSWFREEARGELEVLLGELAAAFGRCPLLCFHIMMSVDNGCRLGMMPTKQHDMAVLTPWTWSWYDSDWEHHESDL